MHHLAAWFTFARQFFTRQGERKHQTISSGDYTICVQSGDKPTGACRGIINVKLLGHGEVGEEKELSVAVFRDNFKRGHKNYFNVDEPKMKYIDGIEIRGDAIVGCWNIDKVMVTNNRTGDETVFPVFTNITSDRTYKFMTDDLSLPHLSSRKDDRMVDLDSKRKLYEFTGDRLPGCPPLVKHFPPHEIFSFSDEFHVGSKLLRKQLEAKLDELVVCTFHTMNDYKAVFGYFFPKPSNLQRWKDDVLFGMQRLMSVNPVMIRLCSKIPEKLAVNNQMLEPFLESKALAQVVQNKRIFIIDYEILDDISTKSDFVMTAPIALFYQRDDGKLVPIAIQLFQKPSADNPVFLPSDPENTWILAKMWFNVADSNYHQSVTHLGFTHLKMEGIVACTNRQCHKDHPIFVLLMPHFLYLIAINHLGIPILLGKDGYIPELLNLGRDGVLELIKRKNRTWRMDIDGTLPAALKDRGVDDPNLLPDYYYRDDAKDLYEVILSYVTKYLELYYDSDVDVQNDFELQNWRNEMVAPVSKQGLGILGVFGENDKFTNKEQVGRTLTSIIFTCSAQHAAVNFRQYEDYGFPPNFPLCLRGSPPSSKTEIKEEELIQHLPKMKETYDTLVITDVLCTNSMHALGDFEVQYIHDEKALKVVEEFRNDLAQIAKKIEDKNNKERKIEKYNCLNPTKVPNSISI